MAVYKHTHCVCVCVCMWDLCLQDCDIQMDSCIVFYCTFPFILVSLFSYSFAFFPANSLQDKFKLNLFFG